jgi:thiol:disulfide interchange protein
MGAGKMKFKTRNLAVVKRSGIFCMVLPALLIAVGIVFSNASANIAWGLMQDDDKPAGTADGDQSERTETKAKAKPTRPPIYDDTADAEAQIGAALAKAKRENRRVLIQWGANWCGWCHLLHDCFTTDPTVRRKMMYEYDLVLVDIGRTDKNLELAEKYQAGFKKQGLPFLTVLDGDGNVIANQETEALESKEEDVHAHDPETVLEFLTSHEAKPMVASEVFESGIEQARESERLVFLHFGAPWCGWCHRLEDWMARDEVKEIMDSVFVDLKIDTDRMDGGDE